MSYFDDLNNLCITSTKGLLNSTIGGGMDFLHSFKANNGRDRNCKFYYSAAGGSVLRVVSKNVVGGLIKELKDMHMPLYKSIFNKKKEASQLTGNWLELQQEAAKQEAKTYGAIQTQEGYWIHALDDWGLRSTDALMMAIELERPIQVQGSQVQLSSELSKSSSSTSTKTLVWYDVTALINLNSDKNLICTKVQGRDYSRKELVSNGDIKFSVSGQITSKLPDAYPADEVQKLIKILQYKGIIRINNQFLDQFGITHIVIENFNLQSREGYKAVQQYTFSAIGLQPEKLKEITGDTSPEIDYGNNYEPEEQKESEGWRDMFEQQLERLKERSADIIELSADYGSGKLLDLW